MKTSDDAKKRGYEPAGFKIVCDCGEPRRFFLGGRNFDIYPCSSCDTTGYCYGASRDGELEEALISTIEKMPEELKGGNVKTIKYKKNDSYPYLHTNCFSKGRKKWVNLKVGSHHCLNDCEFMRCHDRKEQEVECSYEKEAEVEYELTGNPVISGTKSLVDAEATDDILADYCRNYLVIGGPDLKDWATQIADCKPELEKLGFIRRVRQEPKPEPRPKAGEVWRVAITHRDLYVIRVNTVKKKYVCISAGGFVFELKAEHMLGRIGYYLLKTRSELEIPAQDVERCISKMARRANDRGRV